MVSFTSCSLLWFVLTLLIFLRIIQSNHFPLANFYEALIFLTWCLVTLNFIILLEPGANPPLVPSQKKSAGPQFLTRLRYLSQSKEKQAGSNFKPIETRVPPSQEILGISTNSASEKWTFSLSPHQRTPSVQKQVSGAILAPCILFIIAFAQFNLSADITPLVPALKSNWLLMHVSIMICSYTTFIVGGLVSIILLIQRRNSKSILLGRSWGGMHGSSNSFFRSENNLPLQGTLADEIRFSFPLQSVPWKIIQWTRNKKWKNVIGIPIQSNGSRSLGVNPMASLGVEGSASVAEPDQVLPSFGVVPPIASHGVKRQAKAPDWNCESTLKIQPVYNPPFQSISNEYDVQTANRQIISNSMTENSGSPSLPAYRPIQEGPDRMQKKNFYIILDNLSYRMMGIGFPLFTLGILSGAVWANEAWGSYWSWDIKEVGSFVNWLLVALYFHCRYKNLISLSHMVSFIALMVLLFNFFGISLGIFGSSLHAYGAAS